MLDISAVGAKLVSNMSLSQQHLDYDYIVAGAGINGTWAAYHLSKRGHKTLLLDQFPLPHSRGSSHGQSRIIRKAYQEQYYCQMMQDAYEQWAQLEKDTNKKLFTRTGLLIFAESDAYLKPYVDSFQRSGENNYELYEEEALRRTFPQLAATPGMKGIMDKDGGVLAADKCLLTAREMAQRFGCTVVDNFPVVDIIPLENSVHVVGGLEHERKIFSGKSLVICAGAWTNKLVKPLGLEYPLQVMKIIVPYFKANKRFLDCVFIAQTNDKELGIGDHAYGLPMIEYPGLVKICPHQGPTIEPDHREQASTEKERNMIIRFVRDIFPGVDPTPSIEETCMYTVTPDNIHILDRHPKFPNIIVGCGFSGTGFKLGPVTGELLADMALGKQPKYDTSPFRANRFNKSSKL